MIFTSLNAQQPGQWGLTPINTQPAAPPAGSQPQPQPQPTPAPAQPPVPGAAPTVNTPPPVQTYWAVQGQSFHTLAEAGQAMQAGRVAQPQANGDVKAQKITYADTATQKAQHASTAKRYLINSVVTGIAGSIASAIFPPLMIVGSVLSMYNGYKAFQEWQASQQNPAPTYIIAEEGRIESSPVTQPLPYTYEAVNTEHYGNVVPGHPFFYKPAVPVSTL